MLWLLFPAALFFLSGSYMMVKLKKDIFLGDLEIVNIEYDRLQTPIGRNDRILSTNFASYDQIQKGESLYKTLRRMGVTSKNANLFTNELRKKINLRRLRPNDVVMVEGKKEVVNYGDIGSEPINAYKIEPRVMAVFVGQANGLAQSVRVEIDKTAPKKVDLSINKPQTFIEHEVLGGYVDGSIYSTIIADGGNSHVVNSFSDIFAWQFDFFKDTRDGDHYQMIVEKVVVDGRFVRFGKVIAAEYTSQGQTMRGFYFESSDRLVKDFFDEEGKSLRNAFLKAPMKLANISSKFGMRFHPVLGRYKPHNGVDYGAVRGTPFMAVARGTVINVGYSRYNGNWVRLKHLNGYVTEYLHATRLADLRLGDVVEQGQVIGYVGKTGMATGYHLHFGMKKNGRYVDPTRQQFAKRPGIPDAYVNEFKNHIRPFQLALNGKKENEAPIMALKDEPDKSHGSI